MVGRKEIPPTRGETALPPEVALCAFGGQKVCVRCRVMLYCGIVVLWQPLPTPRQEPFIMVYYLSLCRYRSNSMYVEVVK